MNVAEAVGATLARLGSGADVVSLGELRRALAAGIPPENLFSLSAEDRAELAERMRPLWDEWVQKADAKGMPGQKILDEAARLLDLYDRN